MLGEIDAGIGDQLPAYDNDPPPRAVAAVWQVIQALGQAKCLPPPAPSAWFMQPVEPNLTRRTLNELSPSPMPATKD